MVTANLPGSSTAIMNNSSSHGSFSNLDTSLRFAGYYSGAQDGPPRFYRFMG